MQEVTLTFTDIWTDMTLKGLDRHFDVFNLLGENEDFEDYDGADEDYDWEDED